MDPLSIKKFEGKTKDNQPVDDQLGIGRRLRMLRKARRISLQTVADRAGLSVSLISQIERGLTSPSVRSMRLLAGAVGVPTERLFYQPESLEKDNDCRYVVRTRARRVVSLESYGMLLELVSPPSTEHLQTFIANISPGGGNSANMDTHTGEEAGIVLSGQLELWIDDNHLILSEGDSFCFAGKLPHRYINPGRTITRVHFTITPPFYSR